MHISKLHASSDWAFLVLRIVLAAIFFYHGYQKWHFLTDPAPESMSVTMLSIMRFLAVAEPLAAVAVLIGFCTQLAALGLTLVMISAIYMKSQVFGAGFGGQGGWEFELALLAGALVVAFHGAGGISIDRCSMKKKK